ncbi:hypothetical protein ACIQZB_35165 [Streptomyces sp. NPDC097727]|uniref:class III lanthionine synthetase LanKC N-terminal domain-containing protein n=1 Tax=Streptomyces sp. NPDC097727 TaxID=3366092 RepID=UPI003827B9E2
MGMWECLGFEGGEPPPEQGWKVHIGATPDNADQAIEAARDVCRRRGSSCKFLRSRLIVSVTNATCASRAVSGEVITFYPHTSDELRGVITELDAVPGGQDGPYVRSDLRWNDGPVSMRYGTFALMWCELPDGTRVPALRDPSGRPVPTCDAPCSPSPNGPRSPTSPPSASPRTRGRRRGRAGALPGAEGPAVLDAPFSSYSLSLFNC